MSELRQANTDAIYFLTFTVVGWKQNNKLQVTQSQDYYPFGLTYNAYQKEVPSVNRYKFQGQEHQDDFDLGWSQFKWRNSDPSIGRFFNIDPLSEDYKFWSPYAFSGNRITDAVELEGLEPVVMNGNLIGYHVTQGQGPTHVASDINNSQTQERFGYSLNNQISWRSIVDNPSNAHYFNGNFISQNKAIWDIGYQNLNMNPGDYLNLSDNNVNQTFNNTTSNNTDQSAYSNSSLAGGTLTTVGELLYSSQKIGIGTFSVDNPYKLWTGKNLKLYSGLSGRGPNQYTGSRTRAKNLSRPFKIGGSALGLYSQYSMTYNYVNGRMTDTQYLTETFSNGLGTFGGIYGAAWSFGWETGRYITNQGFYQNWKNDVWLPYRQDNLGY